jgi:predicted  nucleic acid-binding Zn-ribbon protein
MLFIRGKVSRADIDAVNRRIITLNDDFATFSKRLDAINTQLSNLELRVTHLNSELTDEITSLKRSYRAVYREKTKKTTPYLEEVDAVEILNRAIRDGQVQILKVGEKPKEETKAVNP